MNALDPVIWAAVGTLLVALLLGAILARESARLLNFEGGLYGDLRDVQLWKIAFCEGIQIFATLVIYGVCKTLTGEPGEIPALIATAIISFPILLVLLSLASGGPFDQLAFATLIILETEVIVTLPIFFLLVALGGALAGASGS